MSDLRARLRDACCEESPIDVKTHVRLIAETVEHAQMVALMPDPRRRGPHWTLAQELWMKAKAEAA